MTAVRHGLDRLRRIHLIGIGGAGMGGIAEVLHTLGFEVTGSDVHRNEMTRRLSGLGVRVHAGHHPDHVRDRDVVVVSTAIPAGNPELEAARERQVPVVPRAEMLGEIMRFRHGIAVAGTHGKTTTTSLVTSVLSAGGLDPTFVIGGRLLASGANGRLGDGRYIVAEADESDESFLLLRPEMAVVTNIDQDHMGTWDQDESRLHAAFVEFLRHLPFYGLAVLCADDPGVRAVLPQVSRPVVTYGFHEDADLRAVDVAPDGTRTRFRIPSGELGPEIAATLNLPGRHNVLNALAAVALARSLDVDDERIREALAAFQGIGRRFEVWDGVRIGGCEVRLVDDYGHHPREIEATVTAAREAWPDRRLVVAFQPHRYTRTRDLLDDFARVLSLADALLVTAVYPAGEEPIPGADAHGLCHAVRARGVVEPVYVPGVDELEATLRGVVRPGDVLMLFGAGDIGTAAARLAETGEPCGAG